MAIEKKLKMEFGNLDLTARALIYCGVVHREILMTRLARLAALIICNSLFAASAFAQDKPNRVKPGTRKKVNPVCSCLDADAVKLALQMTVLVRYVSFRV